MPKSRRIALALLLSGLVSTPLARTVQTNSNQPPLRNSAGHASLVSGFIENQGQWNGRARYAARLGPVAAALEPDRVRLRLDAADPATIELVFEGASSRATLDGQGQRRGVYNFISGNIASAWRTNVPSFHRVLYRGIYDGVDVQVREQSQRFEYDLILAPHADLRHVVVRVDGASLLALDGEGSLMIHTATGVLRQTPPITSEILTGGAARPIESRFRLIDAKRYGFEAPDRDVSLPAVVDPGLIWSTLTGGTGAEDLAGFEAARDGAGDLFISGTTTSTDFATAPSPAQTARYKAFVARLDVSGGHYDFVTFINGLQNQTYPGGMAADTLGGVTLAGTTVDLDFPVTSGAYQTSFASPINGLSRGDGFVTRFDAAGAIVASTYLGGIDNDGAGDVVIDSAGNLIVTGTTSSVDFPTTAGAYDRTFNAAPVGDNTAANQDTFIARLSSDLSQLTYGTYFGGQTYEVVLDSIVDAQGFLTVAGGTTSSATGRDMPVTADAFDSTWNGSEDGFIARFKLDGNGTGDLKYSSFLGGVNIDTIEGIAFDPNDSTHVIVAGHSWYDNFTGPFFPTTTGAFKPKLTPDPPVSPLFPHSKTGFVTKFHFPTGSAGTLVWSTFAGGNWEDWLSDIAIDETGSPIVAGGTRSYDLPTSRGAHDRTQDGVGLGPHDCFVWKLSPNGAQLTYSTYIGGVYEECAAVTTVGAKVAYLGNNTIAISGMTGTGDFETSSSAVLRTAEEVNGGDSPFVATLTVAADNSGDLSVSTPTLQSPPNNLSAGGSGGVVRLAWTAVDDPSGIEGYVYEVSSKPDFPSNFTSPKGSVNSTEVILESVAINTQYFWRVRAADRAGNLSDWSAAGTFTAGVTGGAPIVSSIQVYPNTVPGGATAQGVLHLSEPAPAGGATVLLSSKDSRGFLMTPLPVTIPATVSVPAGALSANFTVSTTPVTANTPIALYATIGGVGAKATMAVDAVGGPRASSLMLDPLAVTGGNPSTGIVTLSAPAAAGGTAVPLLSSHPQFASVPSSVMVPEGATTATFPIVTSPVPFSFDATIEAPGAQNVSRKLALRTPGPRLTSFALSSNTVSGGSLITGTLTFSGAIPPSPFPATGDALVTLKSTHPAIGLSPLIAVAVGQSTATFNISVRNVPVTTTLELIAAYDNTVLCAPVTVNGTPATVASLTLNATTLSGGQGGVGHVSLTAPAPAGHVLVNLSASHPSLSLPADVTISSGSTSGSFSYLATAVPSTTAATITASYGASSAGANLTINPSAPNDLWVTSLTLNPTTVVAGGTSTATVTINAPAPTGGSSVQISPWSPATGPASVVIPAGSTSATFTVGTTSVTTTTLAKVWALLNTTWAAGLTVTPGSGGGTGTPAAPTLLSPSNGATPTLPVAFDWSDVANAASYQLQVDDSSSFTTPRVIDITVTASQHTASSLALRQHWWRVRGRNSAGTAGAWSTVRSFTPRSGTPTPPSLSAISVSPSSATGGATVQGTATLTSAAPSGGAVVTLSSNNTSAATVPASVTVAAGATSATFAVTTRTVTTSTTATISGAYNAVTRTASVTVNPAATGGTATLTVSATGRSGERITSSPAGINVAVGSSGSATFTAGTSITLSVTNGRDAIWSGACSSGGNKVRTCTFTLNSNASVSANVQ